MSEEIEKRDESIEKAAKVIQMLRSDVITFPHDSTAYPIPILSVLPSAGEIRGRPDRS